MSIAKERNGFCLSKTYKNNKEKLFWKCGTCNNEWYASLHVIKSGSWCPNCKKFLIKKLSTKHTIKECKNIAKSKNGVCLSTIYENYNSKLEWKCNVCNTVWKTSLHNVNSGKWCPECGKVKRGLNNPRRLNLELCKKIAKDRGGQCLSEKYEGNKKPLKWKCANGHIWKAAFGNIKNQNQWCPLCNVFIGEEITRKIMEHIFKKKFEKVKPSWLLNNNGNCMELDGYNDNLKIGFEYQGKQHYEIVPNFKIDDQKLKKIKENDFLKKILCKKRGIILITIPYWISYNEIQQYIKDQYKKLTGYKIATEYDIDHKTFEIQSKKLLKMKDLAEKHGGQCHSKVYINDKTKLQWMCKNGHTWETTPSVIKRGHWCKKCATKKIGDSYRHNIEDMFKLAKMLGGEKSICLSKNYLGATKILKWKCSKSHIFYAKPSYLKYYNLWCPYCTNQKIRIGHQQKYEKQYNNQICF
jgi:hypothetical protein